MGFALYHQTDWSRVRSKIDEGSLANLARSTVPFAELIEADPARSQEILARIDSEETESARF